MNRETSTQPETGAGDYLDQDPKVSEALKRGVSISVMTWSARKILGTVSDRDTAGLLVDVEGDDAEGYASLPWSSVERADTPAETHRQVKVLQS